MEATELLEKVYSQIANARENSTLIRPLADTVLNVALSENKRLKYENAYLSDLSKRLSWRVGDYEKIISKLNEDNNLLQQTLELLNSRYATKA